MAVSKQTMTDEQRKSVIVEYLKAFDKAGKTSDGGSILDLFADDAQVYFPKWGIANGKKEIGQMFGDIGSTLKSILHHYSHFNYIFSGSDDPVGQRLEGVRVLIDRYRSAGLTSIAQDFYSGGRHEMLHEINRRDVITNLLVWMSSLVERRS